ncbi:hypothetical protein [Pseudomonas sp.]|uniref:hypothetical protein n=1 Tax=Pseudomonas sp. TaxID=306 RepID=UPI0031B5A02B
MINVISIDPGTKLALITGALVEVVENVGDGQWLSVKPVDDNSSDDEAELVHASDIKAVAS